jgi:hypothetical protein
MNYRCIRIKIPNPKAPNLPGIVEYEIYDEPEECKKRIIELENTEKFLDTGDNLKKCFRHPAFQDPETQDPENPYITKETKKEKKQTKEIVCVEPPVAKPAVVPETPIQAKSVCVDSSLVAPHHGVKSLTICHPDKGKPPHVITKEQLYEASIKLKTDWTKEEIEDMWIVLENYSAPVRDLFRFIQGTILNKRKKMRINSLKESQECKLPTTKDLTKKKEEPLKNLQEIIKPAYSESDMLKQPLVDAWKMDRCRRRS